MQTADKAQKITTIDEFEQHSITNHEIIIVTVVSNKDFNQIKPIFLLVEVLSKASLFIIISYT